jgi:hypothetical protein
MGTHPSHPMSDYIGNFSNPAYGSFSITQQGDSLFLTTAPQTLWLRHYHYDIFEGFVKDPKEGIDTAGGVKLQFNMDLTGNIAGVDFDLEPSIGHPIVFTRAPLAKKVSKEELQKYVGDYQLGASLTIKVLIRDAALYLSVPGQPDYELVPIDINKFSIKQLTNFTVQFNTNDKGEVIELLSIQPNGTFKATKKN